MKETIILDKTEIGKMISSLKRERNQIDERIMALEVMGKWLGETDIMQPDDASISVTSTEPGLYSTITLRYSCFLILQEAEGTMTARQVTEKTVKGGYPFKAQRPDPSVSTTLKRLANDGFIKMIQSNRGLFFSKKEGVTALM